MSCSSDTSAYTTELDRTGATAGVPTSVTTASKTPGTMRVMGSSSQSIDDVCTAVSRTLLPTPPTTSANTIAAPATKTGPLVPLRDAADKRPLSARSEISGSHAIWSTNRDQRTRGVSSEQFRVSSGTGPWHQAWKLVKSLPMGSPSQG